MATTETSPLLPRGPPSASKAASRREKEPSSPTLRRRATGRNGSPPKAQQHPSDDDDDSDKSSDDQEDEYDDGAPFGGDVVHEHHNVTRRAHRQAAPLSYASDSSATPLNASLGLAKRKPRWAGFRSKVATLATNMEKATGDVVPRKKTRRNRFRSSDFDEALEWNRVGTARDPHPPSNQPAMARVAAYCTSDQISVFKLLKWLDKAVKEEPVARGRFQLNGWKNKMYMGVVHASYNPHKGNDQDLDDEALLQRKDAFYFATGCCVFWGLTKEEEATHIQALAAFSTGRVSEIEAEDMEFTYGDVSRVANDAIFLSTANVEEKLAISFAMSQSAKLDVFEERVEDRIRNTKHIPSNLATTGSIQYSQTDISKLIGQLFIELADVNLHSDILDEPDFLWEDDEYEPLYKKMVKYLDVANRVKILNKRLDILRELVEVLNQELAQQHGTKLEWIIIWLLVVEIVISLFWNILIKDLLGFFNRK